MNELIASFGSIKLSTDDFKQKVEQTTNLTLSEPILENDYIKKQFIDILNQNPKKVSSK